MSTCGKCVSKNQKKCRYLWMVPYIQGIIFLIESVSDHGHLYTGQLCRHFVFRQVDIMGGNTWDPNYAPGLDFLDHIFFNLKNSGQDLSNEGSNFILSSLEVGH